MALIWIKSALASTARNNKLELRRLGFTEPADYCLWRGTWEKTTTDAQQAFRRLIATRLVAPCAAPLSQLNHLGLMTPAPKPIPQRKARTRRPHEARLWRDQNIAVELFV